MFLSILPDVDLVFRLAGIDLGHRTITHSAIIWLIVGGILIVFHNKVSKRFGSSSLFDSISVTSRNWRCLDSTDQYSLPGWRFHCH
jgi:membrane-bound metal-dependent hydrolase YbcI (DUF457 family)